LGKNVFPSNTNKKRAVIKTAVDEQTGICGPKDVNLSLASFPQKFFKGLKPPIHFLSKPLTLFALCKSLYVKILKVGKLMEKIASISISQIAFFRRKHF